MSKHPKPVQDLIDSGRMREKPVQEIVREHKQRIKEIDENVGKPARPPLGEDSNRLRLRRNLTLDNSTADILKRAGRGNMSLGVDICALFWLTHNSKGSPIRTARRRT